MQPWLIMRAWTELFYIDVVGRSGFKTIQRVVNRTPVKREPTRPAKLNQVIDSMQTACALYIKPTLCLQRSAAATRLLRRQGIPAELVIGCRQPPLKAHAWVEVAGDVVSDEIDGLEFYRVLDRW